MARNLGLLICFLILAMDVSAGILGIEAEIAQNKVKHLKMWIFECRDPSYTAFKYGLAACILLALAHVTANLLGGCLCVVSRQDLAKSSANKQLAVASLIFSWIILAIAFSLLIVGTMANSRSRKSCGISHHRVLSLGGILCFIHGLFAISYYISATASTREQTSAGHA
ncbi:Protein DESIGUAL 2 [Cardamine amara subsp. amara]|uniref:Protein DESIGUAL 2 n=1 Tax=Cardamine amara subsp. amara TaxID=228776 RepID=A0ABD0ZKI8_CARAN